jgi:Sulfotransferase domain
MTKSLIWQGTFGGRFEDKQHALAVFERHNQDVIRRVPADRLLVYEVKEGWEPLCRFLDVPVPAGKPFPRLNDTAEFQRRRQDRTLGDQSQGMERRSS